MDRAGRRSGAPAMLGDMAWGKSIVGALGAAWELASPLLCGGCGRRGAMWCDACARTSGLPGAVPRPVPLETLVPLVHGEPPTTWAAGAFEGPLARGLAAYKDQDRRDLARVFGPALRACVERAAQGAGDLSSPWASRWGAPRVVLVVPMPATRAARIRRGDVPLDGLLRVALRDDSAPKSTSGGLPRVEHDGRETARAPVALTPVRLLVSRGGVSDQRRLSRAARARNVHGSMHVRPAVASGVETGPGGWPPVVLVDDICTTGSTLAEAARAVRAAGASTVVAAVVAATPATRHRRS